MKNMMSMFVIYQQDDSTSVIEAESRRGFAVPDVNLPTLENGQAPQISHSNDILSYCIVSYLTHFSISNLNYIGQS